MTDKKSAADAFSDSVRAPTEDDLTEAEIAAFYDSHLGPRDVYEALTTIHAFIRPGHGIAQAIQAGDKTPLPLYVVGSGSIKGIPAKAETRQMEDLQSEDWFMIGIRDPKLIEKVKEHLGEKGPISFIYIGAYGLFDKNDQLVAPPATLRQVMQHRYN